MSWLRVDAAGGRLTKDNNPAPSSGCCKKQRRTPLYNRIPMALTPTDVSRIALLARLELSAAEQAAMLGQLNGFFDIVERMRAVDTTGIEPLYTPLSAVQQVALRLRDDAVTETVDRAAQQRSAPAVEDGLYLVPRVIE